jgi:hypothetical protein
MIENIEAVVLPVVSGFWLELASLIVAIFRFLGM